MIRRRKFRATQDMRGSSPLRTPVESFCPDLSPHYPPNSTATWTPVNSTWYGLALTGMSGACTPLSLSLSLSPQPSGRTCREEWNVADVLLYLRRCSFRLVSALDAFINQPGLTCRLYWEDKSILSLTHTHTSIVHRLLQANVYL